jgi:hypothetical protein
MGDWDNLKKQKKSASSKSSFENYSSVFTNLVSQLNKQSSQDSSKPQRSATGESEGLGFQNKKDNYMQGPEAWGSLDTYFHKKVKTPNPFTGDHNGQEKKAAGFPKINPDEVEAGAKGLVHPEKAVVAGLLLHGSLHRWQTASAELSALRPNGLLMPLWRIGIGTRLRRWSTITWRIGAAWIDWPHDSCNHTCCASGEV